MVQRTKHATTNYRMLKPFVDVVDSHDGYRKFKSEGYMDLSMEDIMKMTTGDRKTYIMMHNRLSEKEKERLEKRKRR